VSGATPVDLTALLVDAGVGPNDIRDAARGAFRNGIALALGDPLRHLGVG
jgi:hypothetical protein